MVHALLQTHSMLVANGLLINVHDLPAPHLIEIDTPAGMQKVGWLLERDDFKNTRRALISIAQVVADGYFNLEDERDFDYRIYADGLIELQEWLADWWESAVIADGIVLKLEGLLGEASEAARVVLALRSRMIKLRAIETKGPTIHPVARG